MSLTGYKRFLNRRKWETGLTSSYIAPPFERPDTNLSGTHSFDMEIYLEQDAQVNFYLDPNGTQSAAPSFILDYIYTGAPQIYRFNVTGLPQDDYNLRAQIVGRDEYGFKYLGGSFEPNEEYSGVGPYFEPVLDLSICSINSGLTALSVPMFNVQSTLSNIQINWSAISSSTGYQLEKGLDGMSWSVLATTDANTLTYNDADFIPGPTALYYYRIKAIGNSSNILDSSFTQSSVNPTSKILDTPIISLSNVGSRTVTLAWLDVENRLYYEIFRSNTIDGTYSSLGTASNTVYQDTDLNTSTVYHYKLMANGDGTRFINSLTSQLSVQTLA